MSESFSLRGRKGLGLRKRLDQEKRRRLRYLLLRRRPGL